MGELIYKEEAYRTVGACLEVYREKGCGFLEGVYQECIEIEMRLLGIPFEPQPPIRLAYKGHELHHAYVPDVVCFGKIVLELKAVAEVTDEHRAQVINYLKATGYKLGLLANFGHYPGLEWERLVLDRKPGSPLSGPIQTAPMQRSPLAS